MYDVQGFVTCATFSGDDRLLLAVSREHLHEVWELSIPDKVVARKDAGLVRNRDFTLLAAGYTGSLVKQMLYVSAGVVTSGSCGIYLYSIPQSKDESDVISLNSILRSDVKDATLALSGATVYSGTSLSSISSFNLNSQAASDLPEICNNTTNSSTWGCNDMISNMSCVSEKLFIGLRDKGNVLLCDPRTGRVAQEIVVPESSGETWTMDVSCDGGSVVIANSCGVLNVFDLRNNIKSIFATSMKVQKKKVVNHRVCISPGDSLLSVSGYDKHIQVFNLKIPETNGESIFSHDGHRGHNVQNIVTHLWHPTQKKLLFSADDTGKLQAWRFK
ncbi:WD repeat-containing protein 73-like isoform X2 [Homarus americanus]|nr:WD repeat-containing protein 73-like isoform X2 [Homarus americanus]